MLYVAEVGGEVVGFIDLTFEESNRTNWYKSRHIVWIEELVVAQSYRRRE